MTLCHQLNIVINITLPTLERAKNLGIMTIEHIKTVNIKITKNVRCLIMTFLDRRLDNEDID